MRPAQSTMPLVMMPGNKEIPMSAEMTPAAKELVAALQYLHGADHSLRMCLTLLRQTDEAVPETVEDALSLIEDALQTLES